MSFTPEQIKALEAKLDRSHVKARTQAGRQLSYIEGWWAIAEANRIFGFDQWHRETVEVKVVAERERKIGKPPYEKDGWGVTYIARVRISVQEPEGDTIHREGCGAGHGIDVDLGAAHESAIKEAETDAMKRALMTFGNPFGLALYDKEQANVETKDPVKAGLSDTFAGTGEKVKKDPLGPWKGPLGKSDLTKKLRQLTADLNECGDLETLEGVLSGYQGVIDQLKVDVPLWWDGEASDGFTPLKQRIEDRRAILTQPEYMKAG